MENGIVVREGTPGEMAALGRLLVSVYRGLAGFPSPDEQPRYYETLADIGALTQRPGTAILVAADDRGLLGGVVYFADMAHSGGGGSASGEHDAAGFRFLAVDPAARGRGVGRALMSACIARAHAAGRRQLVIHTTRAMEVAWRMYEKAGFRRAPDLDFAQEALPVFGFRLPLDR
jgi:GNAT superfamily N-acetyltransferase